MEFEDLSIIIRYSGERTYNVLKRQLTGLVTRGALLKTVTGNSFESVLKASYVAGIYMDWNLTLVIDADILLASTFTRILHCDLK